MGNKHATKNRQPVSLSTLDPKRAAKDCSQMDTHLYLASWYCCRSDTGTQWLATNRGVGAVVSVVQEADIAERLRRHGLDVLQVAVEDNGAVDMTRAFEDSHTFIETALRNGQTVLVHCAAGQSRSASVVIAHLMQMRRIGARDAYLYVKERRPQIGPNTGFMQQLIELEGRLGLTETASPAHFLGEYVLERTMGGETTTRTHGLTAAMVQDAIDECGGDVTQAQLRIMDRLNGF